MKYTNSIYTPNLSGKEGNTIFSSNKYGPYSCERKIPLDPMSPAQLNVRWGTSSIAGSWATLSQQQRNNWNSQANDFPFTKKGLHYFLSGFMFFMKLNRNLYEVNEPLMKDLPPLTNQIPQSFKNFYVEIVNTPSGPDLLLYFKPVIKTTAKIILTATKPVSVAEKYGARKLYKFAVIDSSFISGSSIKDYYLKKYFTLPNIYQKVYIDLKSIDIRTGFSSTHISSEAFGI